MLVLGTHVTGNADITPVQDRTPEVRDAIVNAVPNISDAANVTAAHLAAITSLNLRNAGITELKKGDFTGLTGLTTINLFNNQLSSLPDGILAGLTSLTTIRLGRNAVDPLPLIVSLEKVGTNQFKAVAPAGATFDIVLPVTVTNGSISGGATTLTIPHGSMESGTLTVTRTPGTTAAVTVDIGTLPSLPRNHYGYELTKSDSLPLTIINRSNTAPVFTDGTSVTRSVAESTAASTNIGTAVTATDAENDTLTYTLNGTDASAFDIDSTTGQLKTKAALDYETKTSYTVVLTASDGKLKDTITVTINVTDVDEVVPVDPPTTPDPPTANNAPSFYEGESTIRVVPENTSAGVNIGNAVLATDADNDSLAYTLGGVDADAFDLDSSGQLKTKAPLDYETKRLYLVTITVDDEELSSTISVIISVIDVNDTVPSVGFVPVADRTPQVRDAIVAVVPNVTAAADVTEAQVAAITSLNLRNKGISKLKIGDFSGMTSLLNLNLFGNQLRSLPTGTFNGLTALSILRLSRNAVDPLPLIVSLKQTGNSTFKAVITTGAPFNVVLPIRVTNGSISGGITAVKIPQGTMESKPFTVVGTSAEVSFRTLPRLPRNHFGYKLAQSTVCYRTEAVAQAISKALGAANCIGVTELDLATITSLDLSRQSITSLAAGDFDSMISLRTLSLSNNDLTSLPSGIFDNLISLRELRLNSNKLNTVPGGIFSNLTSLTNLYLQSNDLSSLPGDAFDGLSALSSINLQSNDLTSLPGGVFDGTPHLTSILLSNNKLASIPNGLFEGLTQLNQLHLSWNPLLSSMLSLQVSLQKVGMNQLKAVAPSGAPFTIVVPIRVKNGTLADGATAIRIPTGKVESLPITVTRTASTTDAVTAEIRTLPNRPSLHNGYTLAKAAGGPLEVLPPLNSPPVFTDGDTTTRTVAENTVANANIGAAIAATDRDKDKLTYTLGGVNAAAFAIDSATGQLKTKVALNYETKNSYAVTLTVSDGKRNDTITVTINVSNVNEAPTFTDGSSVTREIEENTSAGENIGAVITATDPDNDTLTYSLAGTDATAFSIGSATGQLKTKEALDYEMKSTYSVTVSASDGNGGSAVITVTINVTDRNESSPTVEFTPVSDRTPAIRDRIVRAAGVESADDVTEEHLSKITRLDFSGHSQTSVSELKNGDFDGLTGLTSLELWDHSLSSLPPGIFDELTSLTSLKLRGFWSKTPLTSLPAGVFDNNTELTELHLNENSLSSLPAGIFDNLTKLTYLNLSQNSLSSLPSGIFDNLTNLTQLLMIQNQLSSLPDGIFNNLTKLTELNLTGNSLSSLASDIFDNLTALTRLVLGSNGLGSLPAGIFDNLTALTQLFLHAEGLKSFPEGIFDNLTALTYLNVYNNPIEDFEQLRRLKANNPDINITGIKIPEADNSGAPSLSPVPETTALLANFPNPFNPETWIPYQLTTPSEVTITIYDVRGRVVRVLTLGHQAAGVYRNRIKAAHWDGRNHFGEKVATGLYFYTLKADDFSATRKMLIRK